MSFKTSAYIFLIFLVINMKLYHAVPSSMPLSYRTGLTDFKKQMKDLFGFNNIPRPEIFSAIGRDTTSAKNYMLKLYRYTQGEQVDRIDDILVRRQNESFHNNGSTIVDDADTVVSFVNHAYIPRPNASDEQGSMYFDVSSNLVIEKTLASELRVYLDAEKKTSYDNVFRVTIYQIIVPKTKYLVLTSRIVNASDSDWHKFDVIRATTSWKDDPVTNNGILIVCESINNKMLTLKQCGLVDFEGPNDYRPFLVSFYHSGDADEIFAEQLPEQNKSRAYERIRRSLAELFPRASDNLFGYKGTKATRLNNSSCERHPLYIGFKDLGWADWIIAPEGYKASYCGGECKFPLHSNMNASNHAIIQTLVHLMVPQNIPEPCCAPVRLDPLQVLFLDERNNVVMKKYANMIVIDCGCQ